MDEGQSRNDRGLARGVFPDGQRRLGGGAEGHVLHTSDGGENWELQDAGVKNHLRDVFAVSPPEVWMVGYEGTVLKSADGGKSWVKAESGTDAQLRRVCFSSAEHGVAVGFGGTVLRYEKTGKDRK